MGRALDEDYKLVSNAIELAKRSGLNLKTNFLSSLLKRTRKQCMTYRQKIGVLNIINAAEEALDDFNFEDNDLSNYG